MKKADLYCISARSSEGRDVSQLIGAKGNREFKLRLNAEGVDSEEVLFRWWGHPVWGKDVNATLQDVVIQSVNTLFPEHKGELNIDQARLLVGYTEKTDGLTKVHGDSILVLQPDMGIVAITNIPLNGQVYEAVLRPLRDLARTETVRTA
jgi:hypothetical protein